MAVIHNRIELGGIVDDAPHNISSTMARVRIRQEWTYLSKGQRKPHIQRIYCVFVGDAVPLTKELQKGDNVWIVGQLIRRPRANGEEGGAESKRDSFTFEIHVLEAHIILGLRVLQEGVDVPEQDNTRRAARGTALHPFFHECSNEWPI